MRKYELTYITKPDLDAGALAALIERVSNFVTSEGGAIVKTSQWGLRQLSYPIRKYREGYYVFSIVELEAPTLARLEQRLRLTEDVIRYLIVRADEDGNATDVETADVMGGAADEVPATPATMDAATEAAQALEEATAPSA